MKKLLFIFTMIYSSINAQKNSKLITPPYLTKGDTIAIIAPAGILKDCEATIEKAKRLVESWGLHVVVGKHLFEQQNQFAGTDDERCQDFQKALDTPTIKAIWCVRGGYGSVRIVDRLDFTKFKENPKWIIGYSDITTFHNHINNLGFETLHAMMAINLEEDENKTVKTIASFKKALFGEDLHYEITSSKYNRTGISTGQLVGGNIAILASMLGSQSQLSTEGKILFIEEIGEYKYAIDRMLQSLKRAGYFTKIKAVIVGDITKIKKNTTSWGHSIEELILDVVPSGIPVLFNFPAGHEPDNRALIMGRSIQLTVGSGDKPSIVKFN